MIETISSFYIVLVVMASIGILWVEGSCQFLSWWCFLTCCPCWFIGSQKTSNRLVIREENALIWVDEVVGFLDFHRGFLTLIVGFPFGVHLWRWCVTHQSFRIPYLHNSCREFQFEGHINDTCTQINKYNEFIYLYFCVRRIRKSTHIDACTQAHLLLVFLLLMKSDM